jgi:hypothetical protein
LSKAFGYLLLYVLLKTLDEIAIKPQESIEVVKEEAPKKVEGREEGGRRI